jgi:hypothetical protein
MRAIIPNHLSVEQARHAQPNNLFSGRGFGRAYRSYCRIGTNVSAHEGDCAGKDDAERSGGKNARLRKTGYAAEDQNGGSY